MAKRTDKLVRSPHVDDRDGFAIVEIAFEISNLDPRKRTAQAPDQPRQQGNRGKQTEREQAVADRIRLAGQRPRPA